jgi:ATP/ADP translocase
MVKRAMLAGFAMVFAVGLSVAGQDSAAKSGTWSGVITNDMCGAKDATAAKSAKYALYNDADKKVYILEPQDKADGHAGHQVTVKGTLDGDTIHVTSLTMNTAKGS